MAVTIPLPPIPVEPQQIFTLTAADRCDVRSCDARAYVRVTMADMSELLWCAHHGHDIEPTLRPISSFWDDESAAILK